MLKALPLMLKALVYALIGRELRDWSVVDDGAPVPELAIYACPTSRVVRSDRVLATRLTWDETDRVIRHAIAQRLVEEAREAKHG